MDERSTPVALTARLRKRSISSHRHSTTDNDNRIVIKTKIQKIDGQYKASPTCPINNEEEQANSSDDQDEPLIVATVPPLIQDSSNYRIRQDTYDDETGDDQQSNSSSIDDSPVHQPESLHKSTIITIQKTAQSLNGNETTNETSVHIPTMSSKRSTRLLSEENIQEESVQQRTKITKKSNLSKSSVSNSSPAISIELNQANNSTNQFSSPSSTINEARSIPEDIPNKSITSVDVNISNNKQSQNTNDQSKVKVRLKPMPPSPQTKKDNKPVTTIKNAKSIEQKPTKKPTTIQKETVIPTTKPTLTVTPKKAVKTSITKPLSNANNSEKQPIRPPLTTPSSSSKPIEKKSSDISNSTATTIKKATETPAVKLPPVTLGKIPKLNSANKQKPTEKPILSKSLTDQKLDLLASGGGLTNTKDLNPSEKNFSKRSDQLQQNLVNNSNPFVPLSPMDYVDHVDNTFAKQSFISNQRYPSLLDNNPRLPSNVSRTNSIGHENTQSQSPLSPGPLSTLYPPPSPPAFLPPPPTSRSILSSTKTFIDSRPNQPHLLPSTTELSQLFNKKTFSTPPVLPLVRPSSSSNLINTQSIPPPSLIANDYQDPWTTNKSSNLWDSASSDEESEDNSIAQRFFHQNMRAADEELSKIDEPHTTTVPLPTGSRTEQLLKRQKKASMCMASNSGTYEGNIMETSASVDDFECVAMDLDSPKHRTQSESSDNNHTIVESNNSKNTTNGTADSKSAESIIASSTDTSKKLSSKHRPLKAASMTLIDELKNSINPSSTSKQPVLSPPSRSLSRSRSRTHSRSRSRSRSRIHSQSRSRSRSHSHSRTRSRSRSSSLSSSSSSHKRHGRSRHRSSKRRANKHYQRRRSNSYDDNTERLENSNNNYPPAPMHYQSHHHPHPHPQPHPHHQQPPHWPPGRQTGSLIPGPPPLPYGHQPPVPPLLPYYPPSNRSLMHPVESPNPGGRFNFQHNSHQRHHPPLMHPPYYPPAAPQPLMQSASRSHHHPINRYPPPVRPFDIPPHPMANVGPYPPNPNYTSFKYESEEHLAMRRTNSNNNRRGGPQQTELNGKKKTNNPSKPNVQSADHQDMDQLVLEREKLLAKLNEISDNTNIDEDQSSTLHDKRTIPLHHSNQTKSINSQEDEGEEGEISESD